jgi:uncharacterized protein (UPF0335 family)
MSKETTVRIRTENIDTGDVPMSAVKAALKVVKSDRDTGTLEAFSPEETGETHTQTVAASQLRAFIERIERLEEEKATIVDDIKEVKAEAKGVGFNVGAISAIVKLRKMDPAERQEAEAILDLYKAALGMA